MEKKFFIETEHSEDNNFNELNQTNYTQITNDNLVNDFLNKKFSLETLIENEIYKNRKININ